MTAGYSGTPLAQKLGIKEGFVIGLVNPPENLPELLMPLPTSVTLSSVSTGADMIHFFTNNIEELSKGLTEYRNLIKQDGAIWVSWYKKAAKLPTEITEDTVRDVALPLGLVDIKVCAVDEKWSGLKLVIRRENRV
jgi:Protein of unknown function (DUF3052)